MNILRWLFGKCDYCGNLLRKGGGTGFGTLNTVWYGLEKKIKYSCLRCEMMFDED